MPRWSLLAVGWSWVFLLGWRSLGELSPIDIMWAREVSGGNVLNLTLPPWGLRPDTRPVHHNPASHTAQKTMKKKKKEKTNKQINKMKIKIKELLK